MHDTPVKNGKNGSCKDRDRNGNLNIELQFDRIEDIQQEIQYIIANDRVDGMEALVDEKASRLVTILYSVKNSDPSNYPDYLERLVRIKQADQELEQLISERMQTVSEDLKRAKDTSNTVSKYRIEPAKAKATLLRGTDITG